MRLDKGANWHKWEAAIHLPCELLGAGLLSTVDDALGRGKGSRLSCPYNAL